MTGKRLVLLLPLVAFLALAALFQSRLRAGDPSIIPSVLIGKPLPVFALPGLTGDPGLSDADLRTGTHLLNVWASWCAPCRDEHPLLVDLKSRVDIVGLNYKDAPENARRFLGALGDPFSKSGSDRDGRVGIDFGVYGVPETFLVRDGVIVKKFVGALTQERVAKELLPDLPR